jgi:hypothetical protein
MDPPCPPFVFPHWSFAGSSRYSRPSGRSATVSEMLSELAAAYGLRRRPLWEQFAEARRIDALFKKLDLDELSSVDSNPSLTPPAPPDPAAKKEDEVTDRYPPTMQRPALLELVKALGCRDAAFRRDECGDWRISGKFGHIYAVPERFQIMVRP